MNKLKKYAGVEHSTIFPTDSAMQQFPVVDELEQLITQTYFSPSYELGWHYVRKAFELIDSTHDSIINSLQPGNSLTAPMQTYSSNGKPNGIRHLQIMKRLNVSR